MVFTNFKIIFISVQRRRKIRRKLGNFQEQISQEPLVRFPSNLVCQVRHMEGIKYINLVEIGSVVFELRKVENGYFLVCVNNARVLCATFLAAQHMTVCLNSEINCFIV